MVLMICTLHPDRHMGLRLNWTSVNMSFETVNQSDTVNQQHASKTVSSFPYDSDFLADVFPSSSNILGFCICLIGAILPFETALSQKTPGFRLYCACSFPEFCVE